MINLKSAISRSVLNHFFLHEGEVLYINEMVRRLKLDSGNLTRKLVELEQDGLLKSEVKGNQRYYELNHSFPLLNEYKKIILATVGFEHQLKTALGKVKGLKKVLLFGSYAEGKMDRASDIDLLAVGDHNTLDLQKAISGIQKTTDREINVISLSSVEFDKRQKTDPLLKSIFHKRRISIL